MFDITLFTGDIARFQRDYFNIIISFNMRVPNSVSIHYLLILSSDGVFMPVHLNAATNCKTVFRVNLLLKAHTYLKHIHMQLIATLNSMLINQTGTSLILDPHI